MIVYYHRFLKWCLKCKNILECELVILPERRQCKEVIAWSDDFGMDQYVCWSLSNEELMLDTIWEKFGEFCKPQSIEVRARFNLFTCFWQGKNDECLPDVSADFYSGIVICPFWYCSYTSSNISLYK